MEINAHKLTIEDLRNELEQSEIDKSDIESRVSRQYSQEVKPYRSLFTRLGKNVIYCSTKGGYRTKGTGNFPSRN